MSLAPTDPRIEKAVRSFRPGAEIARVAPLRGGVSATMFLIEVAEAQDKRMRYVVRQPGDWWTGEHVNAAKREFRTLELVRQAGIRAPRPVWIEDATSERSNPLYVLEYIEGHSNFSPVDVEGFVRRYARQLAAIHEVNLETYNFRHLPPASPILRPLRESPNETLREGEIRAAMHTWKGSPVTEPAVLRHGDFWPGNVLWKDDEIVAVIDWEEAVVGPAIADVAIARLDLHWMLGIDATELFTALYVAERKIDLSALPFWDLWASLRPGNNLAQWAAAYPAHGRKDVTLETMSKSLDAFVEHSMSQME